MLIFLFLIAINALQCITINAFQWSYDNGGIWTGYWNQNISNPNNQAICNNNTCECINGRDAYICPDYNLSPEILWLDQNSFPGYVKISSTNNFYLPPIQLSVELDLLLEIDSWPGSSLNNTNPINMSIYFNDKLVTLFNYENLPYLRIKYRNPNHWIVKWNDLLLNDTNMKFVLIFDPPPDLESIGFYIYSLLISIHD